MNKNKKYILIALLASLLFTVTIGFSVWIILSEQTRGAIQKMGTLTYTTGETSRYAGESWEGTATYTYTLDGATKTYTVNGTYTVVLDSNSSTNISAVKEAKACTVTFQPSSKFAKWVWGDTITLQNREIVLNAVAYIGSTYYTTVDAALSTVANATTATTVNVIPSGDYEVETVRAAAAKTIANNFTIKPSVTLRLSNGVTAAVGETINVQPASATGTAYDFTRVDDGTKDGLFLIYSQFSGVGTHSDAYFRTDWCENIVTVKSGVTLTNSGTITIDAVVTGAAGGATYSSIVFGNYSKISMQSGGKITNTGTINCYGFIDEATPDYDYTDNAAITDATVQLDMQAGTLNTVFTVSEHRGGNVFMGMVEPTGEILKDNMNMNVGSKPPINKIYSPTLRTFAFHRFFIQSVSVNTKMSNAALMSGEVSMYANGGPNQTAISFMGNSGNEPVFCISGSNAYATFKYTHNADANKRKMDIDVYGDAAILPLSLQLTVEATKSAGELVVYAIIAIDMKTAGCLMPISHYYDVSFNRIGSSTATVDLTQQELKILPGGSLTIGQGVTANTNRIAIYESNKLLNGLTKSGLTQTDPANSGTFSSYGIAQGLDYPALEAGKLTVNGTLNATAVGGPVLAGTDNAVLNITAARSVISQELLQTYNTSLTINILNLVEQTQVYAGSYFSTNVDSTLLAKGDLWQSGDSKIAKANLAVGQYVAKNGAWATPTSVTITFNSMGGSAVASQTYTTNSYNGVTLSSLPTPTRTHYDFDTWCTDSALQNDANGVTVYTDTTLYAEWTPVSYTLEYVYVLPDGTLADSGIDDTAFTIETPTISLIAGSALAKPEGTNYRCSGWYTDQSGGTQVTAINVAEYAALAAANDRKVTIYAVWTEGFVYDIDYLVSGSASSALYPLPSNTTVKVVEGQTATLTPPTALDSGVTFATIQTDPTRQYYFSGWYLDENYTVEYQNWDQLLAYGAPTEGEPESYQRMLYGKWIEKEICITYNNETTPAGATAVISHHWITSGQSVKLPALAMNGYTFYGWYDSASLDATLKGIGDADFTTDVDITLHAKWFKHATVTYEYRNEDIADAGSESEVDTGVYDGITALTLPTPNKIGHKFLGWYTAATGGTKVGDAGADYKPDANITLYAQWEKIPYTITVTTSNATVTGVTNGKTAYYGDGISVTVSFSEDSGKTFTVKAGSTTLLEKNDAGTYSFTMPASNVTIEASSYWTCFAEGTLITLADGTQKPVEELTGDEKLLVWNHYTGRFDTADILSVIDHHGERSEVLINKLAFADGSFLEIIGDHVFYDVDLGCYVSINEHNVDDFIGHSFLKHSDDASTLETVELVGYSFESRITVVYQVYSQDHYVCFTNNILSAGLFFDNFLNAFAFDNDTFTYIEDQMKADIEKYGLYTYEDFKDYLPEEAFDAYNFKVLKVSVAKGLITWEEILEICKAFNEAGVEIN